MAGHFIDFFTRMRAIKIALQQHQESAEASQMYLESLGELRAQTFQACELPERSFTETMRSQAFSASSSLPAYLDPSSVPAEPLGQTERGRKSCCRGCRAQNRDAAGVAGADQRRASTGKADLTSCSTPS